MQTLNLFFIGISKPILANNFISKLLNSVVASPESVQLFLFPYLSLDYEEPLILEFIKKPKAGPAQKLKVNFLPNDNSGKSEK